MLNQDPIHQAHVDIAVLQTKVEAQGREIGELKDAIHALTATVNGLRDTLTEARGGWRTLMLLGGAGATFGGLFTWALEHFMRSPR